MIAPNIINIHYNIEKYYRQVLTKLWKADVFNVFLYIGGIVNCSSHLDCHAGVYNMQNTMVVRGGGIAPGKRRKIVVREEKEKRRKSKRRKLRKNGVKCTLKSLRIGY